MWRDNHAPSGWWLVPAKPRRRRVPGWLVGLIVLALLAATVAVVAGLGGFDTRPAVSIQRGPGDSATTGPIEMSFDRAEVVVSQFSSTRQILVYGSCHNTWDRSFASNRNQFALRDPRQSGPSLEAVLLFGPTALLASTTIEPGARMPCLVQARASAAFPAEPSSYLRVAFLDLEFRDLSFLQDQQPRWVTKVPGYEVWVPATVTTQ